MACAPPQGIASAQEACRPREESLPHRVVPAIPKGDVSALAHMQPIGYNLGRVQEAHQEHSGVTRQPARHTKPAMFWRSAGSDLSGALFTLVYAVVYAGLPDAG